MLLVLGPVVALGGQYAQDFDAFAVGQTSFGDGSTLLSSAPSGTVARVEDAGLRELQLSQWNIFGNRSAFLLPDLDPTNRIVAFAASWISPVYGSITNLGEGFSFSFGSVRSLNLTNSSAFQEAGYGTGLCLSVISGPADPGVRLFANNVQVAGPVLTNRLSAWGDLSSTRHSLRVTWTEGLGVSVVLDGTTLFTNVPVPGFASAVGDSFVWAARNSTNAQTIRIDNIDVQTATRAMTIQSETVSNIAAEARFTASAIVDPGSELPTTIFVEIGTTTNYGAVAASMLVVTNDVVPFARTFSYYRSPAGPLHARFTASNSLGQVSSPDILLESPKFLIAFTGNINSAVSGPLAWSDMNNDGWLDVVAAGRSVDSYTSIGAINYNPGANTAAWVRAQILDGFRPAIGLGDLDNDNRPDVFLVAGGEYGFIQPRGTAALLGWVSGIHYGADTNYGLFNVHRQSGDFCMFYDQLYANAAQAVMADLDRDGREDLLVAGTRKDKDNQFTATGEKTSIFWNGFTGQRSTNKYLNMRINVTMQEVDTSVPAIGNVLLNASDNQSQLAAGDLNRDGAYDAFAFRIRNAPSPTGLLAGVYLGDGDAGFDPEEIHKLSDNFDNNLRLEVASACLADFNGDGTQDLLLSYTAVISHWVSDLVASNVIRIWFNDGYGRLTESGINLPQLPNANLAAGDIFNNGRNDIVVSGYGDPARTFPRTVVLRNDGGGVFTPFDLGAVGGVSETGTGLQLADFDNDGRLDFAVCGDKGPFFSDGGESVGVYPVLMVLRNEMDIPSNAPPFAPTNPGALVGDGAVRFMWNNAADDVTPIDQLTYNLRVGTNSFGTTAVSPVADVITGWRKVARPGNCGSVTNILYHLPPGTYYWSVQAVDGGFKGGAWSEEQIFTITNPEPASLYLARAGTTNNLTWPLRHPGLHAERADDLFADAWVTNETAVGTFNGKWVYRHTNNPPSHFYRLHR